MTTIILKPLFLILLLISIISCNNEENKEPADVVPTVSREQVLKDSIARHPDSLRLREMLIQYYRDSGSYDKAIAATGEALQKDSLNARLWDIKATLHFEDEDTAGAISAFEKAIAILPAPEYLMSLGSLYAQTKDPKALKVGDLLLNLEKGKTATEGSFIKGLYYSYAGDKAKAISFFDQCMKMNYTFMPAYLEKSVILYDQAKYEDALALLGKAITLQNRYDEGYYWRGRCLEKLNKTAEAIEEYKTALQYNPDYTEAKEVLGRLGIK